MAGSGAGTQRGDMSDGPSKLEIRTKRLTSRVLTSKAAPAERPGAALKMKSHGRKKYSGIVALPIRTGIAKDAGLSLDLGKVVVEKLKIRRNHVTGKMLDFDGGDSVVLLSGDTAASKMVITKTSPTRFEVEMGTPETVGIDKVEATFLAMKVAAFERQELNLTPPLSSADWHASFGQLIASVSREAKAVQSSLLEET